jgi:hypothetical protein
VDGPARVRAVVVVHRHTGLGGEEFEVLGKSCQHRSRVVRVKAGEVFKRERFFGKKEKRKKEEKGGRHTERERKRKRERKKECAKSDKGTNLLLTPSVGHAHAARDLAAAVAEAQTILLVGIGNEHLKLDPATQARAAGH